MPACLEARGGEVDRGATGLGLALRRLSPTTRVLYVTAHPDDENNAVLALLSRGRGIRTALLTLTRGEGGQNALGPELFEALGVLRTGELEATHRYDGVEQFFSAAYEFGFSFSLEDTLKRWGREETLGDVVAVVRSFRPDVILTMPLEAPGHQHHTASAHLASEAFKAAADPSRFPDQIASGLRAWQAQKIYQGDVGFFTGQKPPSGAVVLDTGAYDPLLGMSYSEFGSLARSSHKSQGEGQLRSLPGEFRSAPYVLVDAVPRPTLPERDILDGVPTGFSRLAPSEVSGEISTFESETQRAVASFDPRSLGASLPSLSRALQALRRLEEKARPLKEAPEILPRLAQKEHDFEAAIALASGLDLEALSEQGAVAPGETFKVTLRVWNQGTDGLTLLSSAVAAPEGWTVRALGSPPAPWSLKPGEGTSVGYEVSVSRSARATGPYWHRPDSKDRYELDVPADRSLPWTPPDVVARIRYSVDGQEVELSRRALYRYVSSPRGGEADKPPAVVPALSVSLSPSVALFPLSGSRTREFRARVRAEVKGPASVRLEVPRGWTVSPDAAPLLFGARGEELLARFQVTAPGTLAAGTQEIRAVATRPGSDPPDDKQYREGYQVVAYDHVEERHLLHPASSRVLCLDVTSREGARVGYVMGPGDEVPEALHQLGVGVTLLGEEDLALSDLRRFTTIVLGIRAYQTRADLRAHQPRLLAYVEAGGHLVVQYNRADFNRASGGEPGSTRPGDSPFAPYPAAVTAARITDAKAPLQVLVPQSPLFQTPNRIGEGDFEGWVQERGIQFLEARDPRYTDLLSGADPYPLNAGTKKGLLVVAHVGKGTWTYVGLGLFRQLPAGVPGAYRLLANLVSRP